MEREDLQVMIVDDSAVVRQVLQEVLEQQPGIQVLATAADPLFALDKMKRRWPDVIVLDIEMPRMDGITFLKKLMSERPTPVVICSTLTEKGAQASLQAMAAGAVAVVTKPRVGLKAFLQEGSQELVRAVKAAARANLGNLRQSRTPAATPTAPVRKVLPPVQPTTLQRTTEQLVAIGTSTGGTLALETVLTALPPTVPGIVIVQHMPEKFTAAFAQRLDGLCQIQVREAAQGDRVLPGRALIAPGGKHMRLRRSGAQYQVELLDAPPVNRHRPSVDVLFNSVAREAGANALGVIMTGMGNDGARGLKAMREAGARTLAQDEASCVVYGMPREAVALGGVERVIPLVEVAGAILGFGG